MDLWFVLFVRQLSIDIMMIKFRNANANDVNSIINLHTQSWRENYQSSLSPEFLNNSIEPYMLGKWTKRLREPENNQHVIVAEENNKIIGFASVYLDFDSECAALLDNLHVSKKYKRQGIGNELMRRAAIWILAKNKFKMFLWVIADNLPAIKFYEKIGGQNIETLNAELPDGGRPKTYKMFWKDVNVLKGL